MVKTLNDEELEYYKNIYNDKAEKTVTCPECYEKFQGVKGMINGMVYCIYCNTFVE